MAYDDDNGKRRFRDFEDLASLLERFLNAPANLTVTRVIELAETVHQVASGRKAVSVADLTTELRQAGLANIPFETVSAVLDLVGELGKSEDVLSGITLGHLKGLVQG